MDSVPAAVDARQRGSLDRDPILTVLAPLLGTNESAANESAAYESAANESAARESRDDLGRIRGLLGTEH